METPVLFVAGMNVIWQWLAWLRCNVSLQLRVAFWLTLVTQQAEDDIKAANPKISWLPTMSLTKYTNGFICDDGRLTQGSVYVDNATQKIVTAPTSDAKVTKVVDLHGEILAPGYIDIQNNGIYGVNFSNLTSDASDADTRRFERDYHQAMKQYLTTGVTLICPTVTSNFPNVYPKVLPMYHRNRTSDECDSLGAHLEGPFINREKKGCHPVETFVDASEGKTKLQAIYGDTMDHVCIITAAPEIPGVMDLIPAIKQAGVVYSIGHTMADHATATKAVRKGALMVTHMYNAMPQPHHRNAGVVGLMTTPDIETPYYGLICDGVHVDPLMARLAYAANPDKVVLVTDAMHLIGLEDGAYQWDGQVVIKDGYRLTLKGTDTLAGSATTLPACVRNLKQWANLSLAQAVKTCTNNAADSIGVSDSKGYLRPGCDADFVVLDHQGYVKRVFKLGNEVASLDVQPQAQVRAHL